MFGLKGNLYLGLRNDAVKVEELSITSDMYEERSLVKGEDFFLAAFHPAHCLESCET